MVSLLLLMILIRRNGMLIELKSDVDSTSGVEVVEFGNCQHVGCCSHVQILRKGDLQDLVCSSCHHFLQSTIYDVCLLGTLQQTLLSMPELFLINLSCLLDHLDKVLL